MRSACASRTYRARRCDPRKLSGPLRTSADWTKHIGGDTALASAGPPKAALEELGGVAGMVFWSIDQNPLAGFGMTGANLDSLVLIAAPPTSSVNPWKIDYSNIISLGRLPRRLRPLLPIFSPPGRLRHDTHEALTLSEWFCEHFIDSAVYLAGALRWIAISTKS
jgi:hypothetical protein